MSQKVLDLVTKKRMDAKDKRIKVANSIMPQIMVLSRLPGGTQLVTLVNMMLDSIFEWVDDDLKEIEQALKDERKND